MDLQVWSLGQPCEYHLVKISVHCPDALCLLLRLLGDADAGKVCDPPVAQKAPILVECLPNMHEILGSTPSTKETGCGSTCLGSQHLGGEDRRFRSSRSSFDIEGSLGCTRPCLEANPRRQQQQQQNACKVGPVQAHGTSSSGVRGRRIANPRLTYLQSNCKTIW